MKLPQKDKHKILDIALSGKGVFPYGKVENFHSLYSEHKDGKKLFKIFSLLKQQIKMKNLSDFNDPFNFQNIAILCKIMKSIFEFIHKSTAITLDCLILLVR